MERILLSREQLAEIVAELAAEIARDFAGARPLQLLGLLKGCQPFLADLSRALSRHHLPLAVDYLKARSYLGKASSGKVEITSLTGAGDLALEQVVVVDDIFDTGLTLKEVVAHLKRQGAGQVKTCVLLRKEGCSQVAIEPDYVGAVIPNAFVVGYGLDYNEQYRELPFIKVLE
jgi:hypoxanthine phosphoribosyltransferase